jgi:hypothetical protein
MLLKFESEFNSVLAVHIRPGKHEATRSRPIGNRMLKPKYV